MGYFWLLLSTLLTTAWALCYKLAVRRQCELMAVNMWVYIGSSAVVMVMFLLGGARWHPGAAALGFGAGVGTFISTLAFFYHIRTGVLTVSWTVIGMALAFPVLGSVVVWNESPTPRQWAGLALIPVALVLFGLSRRAEASR